MSRKLRAAVGGSLSLLVGLLAVSTMRPADAAQPEFVDVLISFKQPPGQADRAFVRAQGGDVQHTYQYLPTISARMPVNALMGLANNPNVLFVEPDLAFQATDLELDNSWGVARIGSGIVHSAGNQGADIKVAVLDSGVDYTHPDLDDVVAGGWDFYNGDPDPMDDHSHGTHIAGTIAAEDNDFGVVGVAPQVQLYALKVMNSDGVAYGSRIMAAIEWCIDNGIHVTNNSYGTSVNPGPSFQAAFDMAAQAGIVMVASAGNSGTSSDSVLYPARYNSVIAVGATDGADYKASWSSTGPTLELAAPGVSILSTMPGGGFGYKSGTSMACPHVVGSVALVLAAGATGPTARDLLTVSALDLGSLGWDAWYGNGLVSPAAAVTLVGSAPQPSPDPEPTPEPEPTPDPPTSGTVSVASIAYSAFGGRGQDKHLQVTVTLVDGDGARVADALVSVVITRDGQQVVSGSGLTGSDGTASFDVKNARTGKYETIVTDVDAGSLVWDGETPINAFSK